MSLTKGNWKYTKDEAGNPVPVGDTTEDLIAWAKWWENVENRRVAHDMILVPGGELAVVISTIFLGLDHNFRGIGKPILWETMVFLQHANPLPENGSWNDCYQARYQSQKEAVAYHQRIVEFLTPHVRDFAGKRLTHDQVRGWVDYFEYGPVDEEEE